MSRRGRAWILLAVIAGAGLVYYFFNPADCAWMPRCVFRTLTGYSCPGCGSQRAAHALLHGRVAEAFGHNALLVCLLPALLFLAWVEAARRRRPLLYMSVYGVPTAVGVIALLIVWTVARNLAGI